MWNSTTPSDGKLNATAGFTISGAYRISSGFLGLEYNLASQELGSTTVTPTTTTVKDAIETQTVYATYDHIVYEKSNQYFNVGGGVGYAINFKFINKINFGTSEQDVTWQANPIIFKLRGTYNYGFSENIIAKFGLGYEYASTNSVSADQNYPGVTFNGSSVVSGATLKNTTGSDVKVDLSGLRLFAGVTVAF